MVGIRRTSGEKEMNRAVMFNIGKSKKRILELFELGLSIDDVARQNDILKKASKEWLELNEVVERLKEEE